MTPPEVQTRQNIGQKNPDAVRGAAEGRNAFVWINDSVQEIEYATDKTLQIQAIQSAVENIKKNTNGNRPALLANIYLQLSTSQKRALFRDVVVNANLSIDDLDKFRQLTNQPKPSLRSPRQSSIVYVARDGVIRTPKVVVLSRSTAINGQIKKASQQNALLRLFSRSMFNSGAVQYYPQGETTIIEQGGRSNNVYLILEGKVKVEVLDSQGKVVKTVTVDSGTVGETSVMRDTPTNARVTALPGAKLLAIPSDNFKAHLGDIPGGAKLDKLLADKFGFLPRLSKLIADQEGVKIRVCRPGEVPIIKDSGTKSMYLVLDGELGVLDTFGEIRDAQGKPVKLGAGQPVGEMEMLDGNKRIATVLNNGTKDVVLLKISKKAYEVLIKDPSFKAFIDRHVQMRTAKSTQSADLSLLKKIGFEYKFDAKVDAKIQTQILRSAQLVYQQMLEINPNIESQAVKPLLTFICERLAAQHLDNPLKYVSHGADHSINTMSQTMQLIEASPEVQAALVKQFGSLAKGKLMAQLVALFHDIGYPTVTEMQKKDPKVPKWKHQQFSADMVRKGLSFTVLSQIIPGLTQAQYDRFVTAIEHHGSDSISPKDFKAARPFRFAALGDNPLLVLMRLSDNLDMLKARLNLVQTDPLFLKTLGTMAKEAERIKKQYSSLSESEIETKIAESNKRIIADALKLIDAQLAEAGKAGEFKYGLMKEIIKGCNHESYPHFASVDLAQNISVKIENGKVLVSLAYNTPLQFVPQALSDFQVNRLKISLGSMIFAENVEMTVDGMGKVKINNGELYINDIKVANPDFATIKTISDAINASSDKMAVEHFAPPPSKSNLASAVKRLPRSTGVFKIELVQNNKIDPYGAFGPTAMAEITRKLLAQGKKAAWISVNVSKLKYFNDIHGHEAGNNYLQAVMDKLTEATKGTAYEVGGKPMIVRQGPNFFILLEEGANLDLAAKQLTQVIKQQELTFEIENADGITENWAMDLSPHVYNNTIVFDPAKGEYDVIDIHNAANRNIHYLNMQQMVGKHITIDPQEIKKFNFSERIVDYHKYTDVQPFSYIDKFKKVVAKHILKMQKGKAGKGTIAYFDGNKTGGYRAWGFAGEVMINALFQKRMPKIVEEVFTSKGHEVTVVRYGPGSEEFFIFGKNMDSATMKKCMLEFMQKLSEPFKVRIEVSELMKTGLGRSLLSGRLTGKKPRIYTHTYADKSTAQVVDVDVNDPRGPRGEHKGASITASVWELKLFDPNKVREIAETSGKTELDVQVELNKDVAQKAGEAAKKPNWRRGNSLVRIKEVKVNIIKGKVNVEVVHEIYLPCQDKYVSKEYLDGKYRQELLLHAKGNHAMETVIKALTPEELAQVEVDDVKKGEIGKVAGPRLCKVNTRGIQSTADLVRAIGEAPEGSIVVYESAEKIVIRGRTSHFAAWLFSENQKKADRAFMRIVNATARANRGVPKSFLVSFLSFRKAQLLAGMLQKGDGKYLEVELPLQELIGQRSELIDKLTTFEYRTKGPDGKEISIKVKIKDAQDLFSSEEDVRMAAQERIVKTISENLRKLNIPVPKTIDIFKALKTHLTALQTTNLASEFMNARLSKVYAEVYLQELAKASAKSNAASAGEMANIVSSAEKTAIEAVEAFRLGFEAKVNEYIKQTGKKSLTDAEFKKIWKEIESERLIKYGKYSEYHAATAKTLGDVFGRTGRDGLMGLAVGVILEAGAEIMAKDFNLTRLLKNTGTSGLHWARFGAMCGASEYLLGWSNIKAMGPAMALPALWDMGKVPYAAKGKVLVSHAAGLGGFVFGMKAASWTRAVKIPKVGGWAGLAMAIGGGWAFNKVNAYAYGKSESWRDIVDSRAFKTTGAVLGDSGDYLTAAWGVSLGAGVLAKTAALSAALDSICALGTETVVSGITSNLTFGASALRFSAGALLTLAAVKGGFSLHYHLANNDYEKSIAQRVGKYLTDFYRYKNSDSVGLSLGWWVTEGLGGSFKYDQFVEKGARDFNKLGGKMAKYNGVTMTTYQENYVDGVVKFIGRDFKDSMALSRNISLNYTQSAFDHVVNKKGMTGNVDADYNRAVSFLTSEIQPLTREVILDESEEKIYGEVIKYLSGHNVKDFEDAGLVKFVTKKTGSPAKAKQLLDKISVVMMQNQVKQILLVDPSKDAMGKDLYNMLHFWAIEAPKIDKSNPKANVMTGNYFKNTPIMKMATVKRIRDKFAYFFDNKGRLKPGKAQAFAEWVLSQRVKGKNFKENLQKMEQKYQKVRARQLLVATVKGENVKTTAQDVRFGLVDTGGKLNVNNHYVKKALAEVSKQIIAAVSKQTRSVEINFRKASRQARRRQRIFIGRKRQQLSYLTRDNGNPTELAKANRKMAFAKKKLNIAMARLSKARAELQSIKLQIKVLQGNWHKEKDPVKKTFLAAQIMGLGGSTEGLNQKYLARLDRLVTGLTETNPKRNPKRFAAIVQSLLQLKA